MSIDRFELQQREYQEKGAYHFSDLTLATAEGIETVAKLRLTMNAITQPKPKLVADFGCGEGVLIHSLISQSIPCIGLDLSRQALTLAPVKIRGSLIQADLKQVPLKDGCIDVIAMIAVLEHILPPNIPNVLKEVRRVLRRGGNLVVRVPSINQVLEAKHYQHFTETSLRQVLESGALAVERIIGNHDSSKDWYHYYSTMGQAPDETRYQVYQEIFAVCNPVKAKRLLAICTSI